MRKGYEAFDFAASRFIHVVIRKLHSDRACFGLARRDRRARR